MMVMTLLLVNLLAAAFYVTTTCSYNLIHIVNVSTFGFSRIVMEKLQGNFNCPVICLQYRGTTYGRWEVYNTAAKHKLRLHAVSAVTVNMNFSMIHVGLSGKLLNVKHTLLVFCQRGLEIKKNDAFTYDF